MNWNGLIVFLGTDDLEATQRFYVDLLKLKLWRDQGVCRIYDMGRGAAIGFCTHHCSAGGAEGPIITLLTDNVDGVYDRLTEAGVYCDSKPEVNKRFHIYHFFAVDPNGYKVEIQQFMD